MNYTEEQAKEIVACRDSIKYFADKYIKYSSRMGVVQVKLNDFQHGVIDKFEKENIFFVPSERQSGKSTVAAIILLHQALFSTNRVSVIFARTLANSNQILELIREMYDRLPTFLAISKTQNNRSILTFDNGCSIISAGSNVDIAKGRTISIVYIDESEWFDKIDKVMECIYPAMIFNNSKIFSLSSVMTGEIFRKYSTGNI
jgi:phage terminase large subunit-like protein